MKRQCSNCEYWLKVRDDEWVDCEVTYPPHGDCRAIRQPTYWCAGSRLRVAWVVTDDDDFDGEVTLSTEPTFCCNLFSERG